jgi:mono/diheme cytochrome c family protein
MRRFASALALLLLPGFSLAFLLFLACASTRSREMAPAIPSSQASPPARAAEIPAPDPKEVPAKEGSKAEDSASAETVRNDCLGCHSEDLLRQQRLTPRQWAKTIEKMRGWGAPTDPQSVDPLAAYLASAYSGEPAAFTPETLPSEEAARLFDPLPAGPMAAGSAARGLGLYRDRCLACHGEDGRGGPEGVALTGRRVLDRAPDFLKTVRDGRGRMPGFEDTTDAETADLLAYLRSLPFP